MVIKAKNFNVDEVQFLPPKHILGGNYLVPVRYASEPMVCQLPRCTISRGVYNLDGKHYIDVLVQQNSVTEALITSLQQKASAHIQSLGEYNLSELHVHSHMSIVSRDADAVYHALRMKLPRIGQRYQSTVCDERGESRGVTHLTGGTTVLLIIEIESIYCINSIAGFNANIKSVKICDTA